MGKNYDTSLHTPRHIGPSGVRVILVTRLHIKTERYPEIDPRKLKEPQSVEDSHSKLVDKLC